MKVQKTRQSAFTMVEIMIVVAIIGLLAAIAVPASVHARTHSQMNACISNLRAIEGATQVWALETKQPSTATVAFSDISSYLKRDVTCPATSDPSFDTSYTLHGVLDPPTCNIVSDSHVLPPVTSQ